VSVCSDHSKEQAWLEPTRRCRTARRNCRRHCGKHLRHALA
jgi:hypothetical protein